jgi:branched-subunit amino acid aminotransferase/4-amino-4-deoxychorismate lyase
VREVNITPRQLAAANAVFLSLTSFGIVEAAALHESAFAPSELVRNLSQAYGELLKAETSH